MSEVRKFSDRVAIMHRGVIVGMGGVDDVLESPNHEYVQGLAKAIEDLKATDSVRVG
jgi:ABC-type oligopeptide transport system ATPase subunit